jgi:conjugative transfer signal peptidase TraF
VKGARGPLTVFLAALLLVGSSAPLARDLTLNLTASLPRGLYALAASRRVGAGDIVSFPVPRAVQDLVLQRHYLRPGATLLKHVVAVEGDRVCLDHRRFVVNGHELALIRYTDSRGRPLPSYDFCGPVLAGEVFVATAAPTSLDSRYCGPIALSALTLARPLWTY